MPAYKQQVTEIVKQQINLASSQEKKKASKDVTNSRKKTMDSQWTTWNEKGPNLALFIEKAPHIPIVTLFFSYYYEQ